MKNSNKQKNNKIRDPRIIVPIILPHIKIFHFDQTKDEKDAIYHFLGVRSALILSNSWGPSEEKIFNTYINDCDNLKSAQSELLRNGLSYKNLSNDAFSNLDTVIDHFTK